MKPLFRSLVNGILVLLLITGFISSGASAEVSNQSHLLSQNHTPDTDPGPDYMITNVSLPKQTSWIEPGMSVTPNISIRNIGADDTMPGNIQITASLGMYQLVSRNSTVIPMKGGEERRVTLEYLIPDGIPSREYSLTITLDPEREKTGINTDNNEAKTSDFLTIRTISPKVKVGNCGCS